MTNKKIVKKEEGNTLFGDKIKSSYYFDKIVEEQIVEIYINRMKNN